MRTPAPLELLSPARNAETGIAAISCGADAVYIGGPAFGARAAAGNSLEDIVRLCDFARPYGVRVYVTVNTLACDDAERARAVQMMCALRGKGVSAFILQDTTLLPGLRAAGEWKEEFHASTQCAIRTPQRAVELAGMGFSRLILERELSLAQVRAIREAVPQEVELEFFVHGALCVCYSGQCYLSEAITGRSANRGECAQPCRNRYDLLDVDGRVICADRPLLSLKDFRLIDRLADLAAAGISSFKIEGRLKNEEYVKNVVRAYDKALQKLVDANISLYRRASYGRCEGGFTPSLDKTFNRGYTPLFIDGQRGQWSSGEVAKGMGERIGRVTALERGSIIAETVSPVHNGDGLCIVGRGGEVAGFRADRVESISGAHQGQPVHTQRIVCKDVPSLRPGTDLWRNRDVAFERSLEVDMPRRYVDITVDVDITPSADTPGDYVLSAAAFFEGGVPGGETVPGGIEVVRVSVKVSAEKARSRERMCALIGAQIGKTTGIYRFTLRTLDCKSEMPLLSAAFLNSLRRNLAETLEMPATVSPASTAPLAPSAASSPVRGIPSDTSPLLPQNGNISVVGLPADGVLMRTKYCIRHELGLCSRIAGQPATPLYLRNNGRIFLLRFHCNTCEMTVEQQR